MTNDMFSTFRVMLLLSFIQEPFIVRVLPCIVSASWCKGSVSHLPPKG